MKILLANPRGFCAGVNMAIESLDRALELFGTPIFVYHEIVHNRPVVDRFKAKGVILSIPSRKSPTARRSSTAPMESPQRFVKPPWRATFGPLTPPVLW